VLPHGVLKDINLIVMNTVYHVTGDCISSALYRLSLRLGDFEGLLYGTLNEVTSGKLKDDGQYESCKYLKIENSVITLNKKIVQLGEDIFEYLESVPEGMKVLGWVAGRTEVPCVPSVGDKSTVGYLTNISSNLSNFVKEGFIFALFTYKPASITGLIEIEHVKSANLVSFEYKFFKFSSQFESIKVEIENLKETNTKYNSEQFSFGFNPEQESTVISGLCTVPNLLFMECQSCISEIEELIPEARNSQFELQKAQEENLKLKYEVYKRSLNPNK